MISIHDTVAIDSFARKLRIDPHRIKRFRYMLYQAGRPPEEALHEIPLEQRAAFTAGIRCGELSLVTSSDSATQRAHKLLFATEKQQQIETVVIRGGSGRYTICVSSQVGCAVGCGFCATGAMGLQGNLSATEIIDQLWQANQLLAKQGCRARNVVFMGMGEPLHNFGNVCAALEVMLAPSGYQITGRRLTVSTIGIPDRMSDLVTRFPDVHLAVSLHSARQETRQQLIPLAKKVPLTQLREALMNAAKVSRRQLMIEYVMIEGLNDTPEEATALVDFLDGIPVFVNLIPFNPVANTMGWQTSSIDKCQEFARFVRQSGFKVWIRHSQGDDIDAACGQLAERSQVEPAISLPTL